MRNTTLIFAVICILQANAISAIEISGYVIRKNQEPSPASVYINGEEIAVASASGYFEGEVPEGDLTIFAEIDLPNGTERSVPRTITVSADTTVQLTVAPLHSVTINSELPAGTYGPWLRIYQAVTPSEQLIATDLQVLPQCECGVIATKTAQNINGNLEGRKQAGAELCQAPVKLGLADI